MRQGNVVAALLWAVGVAIHIGIDVVLGSIDRQAHSLGAVSLMLYLGVTIAAQQWVLQRKLESGAPSRR